MADSALKRLQNLGITASQVRDIAAGRYRRTLTLGAPISGVVLKKNADNSFSLDFDAFEKLVDAARSLDPRTHLIVLLGGEAGLRCGEMMALEWSDVDLANRQLTIRRSEWNGHVTSPKGGRSRHVPLTRRLAAALSEHRHLRSTRVLCQDDAKPFTRQIVQTRAKRAARRARVAHEGVHVLRHTFCSHLAMRGAPVRAIQELAGHADLSMTQRYMHLSPAALDNAIRLLDEPSFVPSRGEMLETGRVESGKSNG